MREVHSGQPEKRERPHVQAEKQPAPGSGSSLAGAPLPPHPPPPAPALTDSFLCNSAIWFGLVRGSSYVWELSKANAVRAPWRNKNVRLITFYYWNSFNPESAPSVRDPGTGLQQRRRPRRVLCVLWLVIVLDLCTLNQCITHTSLIHPSIGNSPARQLAHSPTIY